jgi:hypothetical protein
MEQVDDWRKLVRIQRQVLEKVLVVYHRISIDNADRGAIRLRILTCSRGDIDRSAGSIVDNEGLPETFVQFLASTRMKMSLMQPALEGVSTWLGLSSPKAGVAISVALAIAARNLFMPPLGIFSLLQSRLH